jgi:hypothetical protein
VALGIFRSAAAHTSVVAFVGGAAGLCAASAAEAKPMLIAPTVAAQGETATVAVSARGVRGCRLSARGPERRRQGVALPGRYSYTVGLAISHGAATGTWTLRVRCSKARSAPAHLRVGGNPLRPGRQLFAGAKMTMIAGTRPKDYSTPRRRQNGHGGGTPKPLVGVGSAAEDGGRAERAIAWAMEQIGKESYNGLGLRFAADAYGGTRFPRSATILANLLGPREGDRPAGAAPFGALMWFTAGDADRGRNDGHVGISLGDGRMISAQRKVQVDEVDSSRWWHTRYRGWTPAPEQWAGRAPPPAPPPPVADAKPPAIVTPPPELTSPPAAPPPPVGRIVTIDNRITNGMAMMEDDDPVLLTTAARPFCGRDHCTIPDTVRVTGDTYDSAVCQTTGLRFTNGNDHDPADDANPERVESTRYYGVKVAGTTTFGYVSEIWVRATDRGGLGLPVC